MSHLQKRIFLYGIPVLLFIGFVTLSFPTGHSRHNARRASCQSNLKQIALAIQNYLQDSNEKFPPVGNDKSAWVNTLRPYVIDIRVFECAEVENNTTDQTTTDYFYNARLAAQSIDYLLFRDKIILAGDGVDESPANYALKDLPLSWVKAENSPAKRHLGGANYAFADGHVKWYKPEKINNTPVSKGLPTFQFR